MARYRPERLTGKFEVDSNQDVWPKLGNLTYSFLNFGKSDRVADILGPSASLGPAVVINLDVPSSQIHKI